MNVSLPSLSWLKQKKRTPEDVIRSELKRAHDIHPGYLMPSSVVQALDDAGFTIISDEELDSEIALAHQAGVDEGQES